MLQTMIALLLLLLLLMMMMMMALMISRGRVAATAPERKKLSPTTTTTELQRATAFLQRLSATPLVLLAAFHAKKMSKRVRAARRLPRGARDAEVWQPRHGQGAEPVRVGERILILRRKKRQGRGG
jgi:hypothetical protein